MRIILTLLIFYSAFTGGFAQFGQLGEDLVGEFDFQQFGDIVKISGDGQTLMLTTRRSPDAFDRLDVRVYTLDGENWTPKGSPIIYLVPGGYSITDIDISHDGSIVAIGYPKGGAGVGRVRIYEFDGSEWFQLGEDLLSEENFGSFGVGLGLSDDGRRIVISDPLIDTPMSGREGNLVVFDYDGSAWNLVGEPIENNIRVGQLWYADISGDGNTVLTLTGHDEFGTSLGIYRIFDSEWIKIGQSFFSGYDWEQVGWMANLSYDGNFLVFGIPAYAEAAQASFDGTFESYTYNADLDLWEMFGEPLDSGSDDIQWYGHGNALSSDASVLAVMGYGQVAEKGKVFIYDRTDTSWELRPISYSGTLNHDLFGKSMSLDSTGETFVMSGRGGVNRRGFVKTYAEGVASDPDDTDPDDTDPDGDATDVEENELVFSVFPNPVQDVLTLTFEVDKSFSKARVFNQLGQEVLVIEIESELGATIDLSVLRQGLYYLRLESESEVYQQTIIKN